MRQFPTDTFGLKKAGVLKNNIEHEKKEELSKEDKEFLDGIDYENFNYDDLEGIDERLHSKIALRLIEVGSGEGILSNLEKFQGLDEEVALRLVEQGGERMVVRVAVRIRNFKGPHKRIVLRLIEEREIIAVFKFLRKFEGLDEEVVFTLIDLGFSESVLGRLDVFMDKFQGLSYERIAIRMIEIGECVRVIENLEKFQGIDHKKIALRLIEVGRGNIIDQNIDKFDFEPSISGVLLSESLLIEDSLPTNFDDLNKEEQGKVMFELLKEKGHKYWKDEDNVAGPMQEGGEYFGYDKMFRYIAKYYRHDALYNFAAIKGLAENSGLKADAFFGQVLGQVAMDGAQYGGEDEQISSRDYMNSIASSLGAESEGELLKKINEVLGKVKEYPDVEKLQALVSELENEQEGAGDPRQGVFKSWKNLKQYYELTQLLGKAGILDKLQELKQEGKHKLYKYIETLAFHPNVDTGKVMEFWQNPGEFLGVGEVHASTQHERKKPSNYTEIPNLDLTAEDLRDALVEGEMDRLQVWQPLEVEYALPKGEVVVEKKGGLALAVEINRAVGAPRKGIAGEAKSPKKLFSALSEYWKPQKQKYKLPAMLDYLSSPVALDSEFESGLRDILKNAEYGIAADVGEVEEYRAKMNLKSDPDGVVAGNDTACCMPFGSGKNNVYTFNPVCAMFVVQKKSKSGEWRTVAQSVMTKDIDIKKNVAELMGSMESTSVKLEDLVSEDILVEQPKILTADNIEFSNGMKAQGDKEEVIRHIYTDFFKEYAGRFGKEENLDASQLIVGVGHTDALSGAERVDNTFVPEAPVGYSDNVNEKALRLDLNKKVELAGAKRKVKDIEKAARTAEGRGDLGKGIEYLGFEDSLQVSYLEGKAYSDNETLREHLHNMENGLIAKDINNESKGRANMSLKYVDAKGKMQGYIFAYEGRVNEGGYDDKGGKKEVVYIADLAANPDSRMAGGRIMKAFTGLYKENYIDAGRNVPILAEAREKTSYAILMAQIPSLEKQLGVKLKVNELESYEQGEDVMRRVLIGVV